MADDPFSGADAPQDLADQPDGTGAADQPSPLTGADDTAAAATEAQFFDPEQLAPALQAQWKSMQGAFTKARQKDRDAARQAQEKAQIVDRFYSDPQYALQVLQQQARQLGYQLLPPGTPAAAGNPATGAAAPGDLTVQLQQKLGPDLAFLAGPLGTAMEEIIQARVQAAVQPFGQQMQAQTQAQRQAVEQRLLAELDTQHPGWESTYGSQMQELHRFLASDQLEHPTFGSKYGLLLKLANPALSRLDAAQAMGQAARARTATGRSGGKSVPNFADRVRQAASPNDAWELAVQAAQEQLR